MKLPPEPSRMALVERARLYLRKLPISVSGQNGHDRLFYAACQLILGFELPAQIALDLLKTDYNPRCDPEWNDKELAHKVSEASKQQGDRGYLVGDDEPVFDTSGLPDKKAQAPNTEDPLRILGDLMGRLRDGIGDVLYDVPVVFYGFECGPRKLTVLGAPPGAGKTALTMQYVFELLAHDDEINITIANAEMPFEVLLKRELTRRSGVPAKALRFADCTPSQLAAVEEAAKELVPLIERVTPLAPPFNCDSLCGLLTNDPAFLIVDYLQKFAATDDRQDARQATNIVVGTLRELAHAGWGVLALSATTRGKNGHASNDLSLASFKESGEIEFNADAAYLLRDEGPAGSSEYVRNIKLECVKNRHGERASMDLVFDAPHMTFSPRAFDLEPEEGEF